MTGEAQGVASRRRRCFGAQRGEALLIAGKHQHSVKVDREREDVIGPRVDRGDEIQQRRAQARHRTPVLVDDLQQYLPAGTVRLRSEEHTSELQSLMRTSY